MSQILFVFLVITFCVSSDAGMYRIVMTEEDLRYCKDSAQGRGFEAVLDNTVPGPHVLCRFDDGTNVRFGIPGQDNTCLADFDVE